MDKTQRLFAIMDSLRRHRQPITAERLAEEFSVSVRTLYRDVQTLIGLGAPIDGEAGVGYILRPGFFLPPLMFSPEELEALVLGARWVEGRPDESLAKAAARALGKIATATPEDLRDKIGATGLWPVQAAAIPAKEPLLGVVREAMRVEKTLHISYADENGAETERPIWPIALAYYEDKHILAAWCTMRQALRNFRIDRVRSARQGDERFGKRRVVLMKMWEEAWQADRQARRARYEKADS
ncbi:Predicted DNA-binding transcriptional regulator YafY, contains an HTH and WYL domains [Mesorhizobium albiziae]|uniref:Predicted DNA-binding transcriptional regulator YafY, contains an HTH and WYL domains n=1 Tax=Neomesorhizobium albiziae TaxID=335020 RepID=A0A1I4C6P9_9HYPH|nr:YafY family protein [Mesorhizobium albiziae]GLS29432.1 DeoR family transcriptional regulator [Mesorhizobium albiziae]SFK76453.1 Predicted DNA-binding transcriptional regulator YafY, contains an HTH and WYL domains [Mesorhizobium albiziae]